MLQSVHIRNFKSLRDVEIQLGPLTVLIGPNASGKTSILDAIYVLAESVRINPTAIFTKDYSPALVKTHGASDAIELTFSAVARAKEVAPTFSCRVVDAPPGSNQRWEFERNAGPPSVQETGLETTQIRPPLPRSRFPTPALVRFEPQRLASASFGEMPTDDLKPDGSGLASVLATLKIVNEKRFQDIMSALKQVVPSIEQLAIVPSEETYETELWDGPESETYSKVRKTRKGFSLDFIAMNGARFPAALASEGTLLTLGLLALLASPKRGNLVLIENLDRGIHPRAVREVIAALRKLQIEFPQLQIVATSHSPYLIDCIDPTEVRIVCLNEHGETLCASLTEHPDFEQWKDEMLPGEFWSMVGEQWLTQRGQPAESKPA